MYLMRFALVSSFLLMLACLVSCASPQQQPELNTLLKFQPLGLSWEEMVAAVANWVCCTQKK